MNTTRLSRLGQAARRHAWRLVLGIVLLALVLGASEVLVEKYETLESQKVSLTRHRSELDKAEAESERLQATLLQYVRDDLPLESHRSIVPLLDRDGVGKLIDILIARLEKPSGVNHFSAIAELGNLAVQRPDEVEPRAAEIVEKMLPLMQKRDTQQQVMVFLPRFQHHAQPAIVPLRQIMEDEQNRHAVQAAFASLQIDPTIDLAPQLAKWIREERLDLPEIEMRASFFYPRRINVDDLLRKVAAELRKDRTKDPLTPVADRR